MPRLHLVELEDLSWFPASWRDAGTSYLFWAARVTGQVNKLMPVFAERLEKLGQTRIIELGSGGGGPTIPLVHALKQRIPNLRVSLSDLYPNVEALKRHADESGGFIDVIEKPVDATHVPPELTGLRLMCNIFHHLPPDLARGVLADAVRARQPIAIIELVSREAPLIAGMFPGPFLFALSMPFRKPFRWSWMFWTWVIPVLPLFVLWDGLVSCMRVYSEDELRDLTAGLGGQDWQWDIFRSPLGGPARATWLIGYPKS